MTSVEQSLRRNFTLACVAHLALIAGVVVTERFWSSTSHARATMVELVVPADILGDLPGGPGHGRGAWSPPAAPPIPELPGPTEATFTPEGKPAPAPKAPPAVTTDPGEVLVPKKTVAPVAKTSPAAKKPADAPKTTPSATPSKTTGAAGSTGATAADIRAKFAKALLAGGGTAGGTPYGDNKPAGGGDGKIRYGWPGSPDGAANGVVGGVGQGTRHWWYYQHIHDRMYEAWERPPAAANWDRKLMATVLIRVARDGRIVDVKLQSTSGNRQLDETALAAARRVTRLEPVPNDLRGDPVEITVNFQLEG